MPQEYKRSYRKKSEVSAITSASAEIGNKPPQAIDIEEAVIGAMLLDSDCVSDAIEELQPKSFYDPKLRVLFETISSLANERTAIDMLTVAERLRQNGCLDEIGGAAKLADLSQKVGSASHIEYYIKILQQKTIQRDLIQASYVTLKEAFDEGTNVDDLINASQDRIYQAVQGNFKSPYKQIGEIVNRSMERIQSVQGSHGLTGIPSGFNSLDRITMGWQKGNLVIIGARPSMGKTAFALNIARNAAVNFNIPTAFFSLEMADVELSDRLIAAESGICSDKMKGARNMDQQDWSQIEKSLTRLAKAPLFIDETPGINITEFSSKVKRLVREQKVQLVFVDYLQLMHGPSSMHQSFREQEISTISQSLKAIAKEHKITVIALAQLNRNVMTRIGSNGRPALSDLRDSGSIEQDADIVMFVHRPGMLGLEDDKERTELLISKHRNGKTGIFNMRYRGDIFQFVDEENSLVNQLNIGSRVNVKIDSSTTSSKTVDDKSPYNPFDDFSSSSFEPGF